MPPHPGYSEDPRRVNVLLTRAKVGLVVVGHRQTLATSPLWQAWLDQAPRLDLCKLDDARGEGRKDRPRKENIQTSGRGRKRRN